MKAPRSLALASALTLATPSHAQQSATYRIELTLTWSAQTHPHEFPDGGHFSDLIGASHDSRYILFADGQTASSGLELLAENGRATILRAEMEEAARRNRVGGVFTGEGSGTTPGVITAEFDVDLAHSRVSFATMLAPSPDWFTGVSGIDLAKEGAWIDRLELALWAWDAGTDSGSTYAAPDLDTQPRESVRLLATRHFLEEGGLERLGTVTFVRIR
jgi:hypothetical protein